MLLTNTIGAKCCDKKRDTLVGVWWNRVLGWGGVGWDGVVWYGGVGWDRVGLGMVRCDRMGWAMVGRDMVWCGLVYIKYLHNIIKLKKHKWSISYLNIILGCGQKQ